MNWIRSFTWQQADKSGEWFSRAIEINPNAETAYRYWGDALLQQGNIVEARSKYIQGIVAFPYSNASWTGIRNWLQFTHLSFNPMNFSIPSSVSKNPGGGMNITLDPSTLGKDDGSSAWLMYGMERALWRQEKFAKEFPAEKTYRHSLKEEVDSLSLAATGYAEQKKSGGVKHPTAALELLARLQADGMIEPYVLLVRPDKEISEDFPSYQAAHRDKLFAFLDKYLVPQAPDSSQVLTKTK
jgi:tetratricopeptide (TPR) repeat protein